jgi:hypothetical protein
MKIILPDRMLSRGYLRRFLMVCFMLLIIGMLFAFFEITTSAATTCPNCGGVGDPTGAFCDLCESCGSCLSCGYACIDCCGNGRSCEECCCINCGDFCGTCGGCLGCNYGSNPQCQACRYATAADAEALEDNEPAVEYTPYYQDILDIDDEPLPMFDLFGSPIFMFAPAGMPSWAILNVILTVAGIGLSLVTIFRVIAQKQKENKNVDNQCSAMVRNVDNFNNDTFIVLLKQKEKYNERRRLAAFASMCVLSIGALVFLLVASNFKGVIAVFDRWVIIHAILFLGVVVCNNFVFRKNKISATNSMSAPFTA